MNVDLPQLITTGGYLGIWAIVFAESGLLIGFFLPGDSLLFTAGFVASQPVSNINIWTLIFGAFVCAVIGDNVGYATGHRFGRRLFQKKDSWLFKKEYLEKTEIFYEKHGQKVDKYLLPIVLGIIVLSFVPSIIHIIQERRDSKKD
ncbi:MAG: DedA family protein [Oscillatoriales cyanobacterium]|uniref:VTT domain-containing protein n=1 Tax=Microcoleus anatoxicus PTRS2 TaxID=2705321 RepID=A0ABU8YR85_9CYAN|nr:MAG: DedA family protein [Oscillatoriales cyanobacterium]TAD93700.1 MAG: DedA family protein [Oscillatoriales cyanobacterium]TAE01436.1 MAG: DedA family protein [Oscillatoriales cyanobacterium]TAF01750.1 MAG: DedA family protein [Oscillatoriales cyanobacterium]TAF46919.1 MAG: DedA family protein [Oscillatoriales cyanobacterium]